MQEKMFWTNADGYHGKIIYMDGEIQRYINEMTYYSLLGKIKVWQVESWSSSEMFCCWIPNVLVWYPIWYPNK